MILVSKKTARQWQHGISPLSSCETAAWEGRSLCSFRAGNDLFFLFLFDEKKHNSYDKYQFDINACICISCISSNDSMW